GACFRRNIVKQLIETMIPKPCRLQGPLAKFFVQVALEKSGELGVFLLGSTQRAGGQETAEHCKHYGHGRRSHEELRYEPMVAVTLRGRHRVANCAAAFGSLACWSAQRRTAIMLRLESSIAWRSRSSDRHVRPAQEIVP